jgi:hypothetical protein
VHGGPDIDLSAQVAKVKAKARPWKSIISLVFAIGAASVSGWARSHSHSFFGAPELVGTLVAAGTAVAFCVFASGATIGLSAKARDVLEPVAGVSHAAVVRYALVLIGAITTLIVTLVLFGVPVGQLLLGGALTSVFVGIAAQQALSNLFAGLVLLLARPFKVGDSIRLRAGALSGEVGGTVTEIGITYLRLLTPDGVISVPNSQVLNAVVAPLPPGARIAPAPQLAPVTLPEPDVPPLPTTISAPTAAEPEPASPDGGSAGPVGAADGAGGAHRPGTSGEQ